MGNRSRRDFLKGLGVLTGAAAAGCGSRGGGVTPAGSPTATPTFAPTPTPTGTPILSPGELLAPIKNVVVLYMENRSFDQFMGSYLLAEHNNNVNGLTGAEWNPDPSGNQVKVWNLNTNTCADPPHEWAPQHSNWDNGKNDGFVISNATANPEPTANQAMGYYLRSQLPIFYQLADNYALCDSWFCSVMGPTFPNRLYLHGATSQGEQTNFAVGNFISIFNVLDDKGIKHTSYYHDIPFCADYFYLKNLAPIEQFFTDAAAGNLPTFTMIDPRYTGADENDDHPATDVTLGDALVASVYSALTNSPQWPGTLFVLSFDENGGFYDHVAPPTTVDSYPGFQQLGFRVPSIVMGPMVKKGVVHDTFEHVSVISTLTERFGLSPMNSRVSATNSLAACIDPNKVLTPGALTVRPPRLDPVTISMNAFAERMRRGPLVRNQPELQDLCDSGMLPSWVDRRADDQIVRRVLEAGQRVGAVRLVA